MGKLLIKFPTRNRPEKFKRVYQQYYDYLSGNHDVKFVISMDNDDPTMNNPEMREWLDKHPSNKKYNYSDNKSKIQAVNADLNDENADVLLLASDDMIPQIKGYDDIVFHPDTYTILNHEYSYLHDGIGNALGWVACRNDFSAGIQNIRWQANGIMEGLKFAHEKTAVETDIIAPICAAIHRDSWIDFLPVNWYSDDIQCMMMIEKGMHNIVSTAYVHHVGSQSMPPV